MTGKAISAVLALLAAPQLLAQAPPANTGAAPSGPIPLADFARIPFMEDPELSPDGASLASLMRV
jgi:hypothetical protein